MHRKCNGFLWDHSRKTPTMQSFVISLKFLSTVEWRMKWDASTPMTPVPFCLLIIVCLNTPIFFDPRSHVLTKVSQAIEAKDVLVEDPVYQETLHHSFSCQKYVKVFQGRQDLVDRIRNYVQGTSAEPLLVYGYSGCGKTSLMAKAYSMVSDKKNAFPHDDVIKWNHFPRYWPSVWGIHRSPVNSHHKGQWRGALMFSLISSWI